VRNKKADGTVIAQYTVDNFDDLDAPLKMTTIGGIPAPVTALSEDYGYDLNNRITGAGIAVFTHNPMGEILTRTRGGSTDTFGWDSTDVSGRLQTMTVNGTSRTYEYDGLGNRLSSTIGGVTTRYVLDVSGSLSNVLAETDAGGTVTAYYIYGIGLVGKLLPDMAGTARYYHYDRGGNTVALTDDAGNVTDQYAYDSDPYGFNFARQGSTQNSFTFVGRYGVMDEGNNIIYMRARFYDAAIGQFLSEDPINFKGGDLNLYAYVGGNPLRGIDPTGLKKDISLSEMFFDFADTIIDIGTEVLKDASDKIVPLMKGGVLEKSKNLKIPDFAGKALDALTIVLNVGYEWKASNVSWDSLWSGDLSLLTTDDWLDAIAHGTASVTSVSWNSAAQLSGLDIIVKYSSGGERSILLTSDQVIKFTKNVTSPNQSQNSGGSW
jgi:RHS repeat-associated protein